MADGKALPFCDRAFDIVFSNSVIKHLGTIDQQRLFADECRRVGIRYYIQTPNRNFPIEPHFLTPIIHYLPRHIQRKLLQYTPWALITKPSEQKIQQVFEEIRLLDKKELQSLFPDAEIWKERFLGLVKSWIAVRK